MISTHRTVIHVRFAALCAATLAWGCTGAPSGAEETPCTASSDCDMGACVDGVCVPPTTMMVDGGPIDDPSEDPSEEPTSDGGDTTDPPDPEPMPDARTPRCGDGVVDESLGEECDDGNASNGDGCLDTCVANVCGDGFLEPEAEECDNGVANADEALCKSDCTAQRCGDGVIGTGAECDDGNADGGDGCSATCVIEDGYCCIGAGPCVEDGALASSGGGRIGVRSPCQQCRVELSQTEWSPRECDDGLYCNGTETCDILRGCVSSGDPCGGALPWCNETLNRCECHCPSAWVCNSTTGACCSPTDPECY